MNSNVYHLSERYMKKMYKDIILNELITFIFYFVYNILFQKNSHYATLKPILGFAFMAIAVFLLIIGKKRADKAASIHYEVKKNGLSYFDGKSTIFYPWKDFTRVYRNPNRISMIYPYEFYVKDGMFTLHRQLEAPDELLNVILDKTHLTCES